MIRLAKLVCMAFCTCLLVAEAFAGEQAVVAGNKEVFVSKVTRGAGLMPWQAAGPSAEEQQFRAEMEARKSALLEDRGTHPALYTEQELDRARENAASSAWAQAWVADRVSLAEYVLAQPEGWIAQMIPEETPAHVYGFTCPNCVGKKSQEAAGSSLIDWSYRDPEHFSCKACGQVYPDAAYPESARLEMPRMGRYMTYYLNPEEQAHPEDRSGKLAWHWVRRPMHMSFSGVLRARKIAFMRSTVESLAFAYVFSEKPDYAIAVRDILLRFAHCYRHWLYHDYWDTYADCDPLYAAWHDSDFPLEWKRHLSEGAYAKDTADSAAMLQSYWGAGRFHPSTDSISGLKSLVLAYDLTFCAQDASGAPVWSAEAQTKVERDLIVEYIMGAEPYVGGANQAESKNNKAPRIYTAMAYVAKGLGIPSLADTALRGYACVRDRSFLYDGFSVESPAYNNMYLGQLLLIPEVLHGYAWPSDFEGRSGVVDYYATDARLRLMYRGMLRATLPDGYYLRLSDTNMAAHPSSHLVQMGLRRYPALFAGTLPRFRATQMSDYALFHLSQEAMEQDKGLPLEECYFPAWQTAILRHGTGAEGTTLSMAFNPPGGHRHTDNLGLFYVAGGQAVLDDLGYVGDMPVNKWIHNTLSHNLVVVDNKQQRSGDRQPELAFMGTTPAFSVVEATSDAYAQCAEYRRRIVLVKGPRQQSFAVDIFRLSGGEKHAFRVTSAYAASDAKAGSLAFAGVRMPEEAPLPEVGASLAHNDIFGLRDLRSAVPQGPAWQATWADAQGGYRLWMMTPCQRVEASNGPGQRSLKESGRRVRYVDAVREGQDLASTFVAVHEPIEAGQLAGIQHADRLSLSDAGERAVALRVETAYGHYYFLHDFELPATVEGIEFQGTFAALHFLDGVLQAYMTLGASQLRYGDQGFSGEVASVAGSVLSQEADSFLSNRSLGDVVAPTRAGVQSYVRMKIGGSWTGLPVVAIEGDAIHIKDFRLPKATDFELPALRYFELE